MKLTKREKIMLGIGLAGLSVAVYYALKYHGLKAAMEVAEAESKMLLANNTQLQSSVDTLMKAASENVFQEAISTVNNKIGYRVDKKKYLEAALEMYPDDAQTKKAYERVCIELKELLGRRESYEAALKVYEITDEL